MKKIAALVLCLFLLLTLAACDGNEDSGNPDGSAAQSGETSSSAEDDANEDSGQPDGTIEQPDENKTSAEGDVTETTETDTWSIPTPEDATITNSYDGLQEQWTEFSYRTVYQTVADYISLLESMGFTGNVEKWNDGIYHVTLTKDTAEITIQFIHDNRDDIFETMVAQGEEIPGTLWGRIYVNKQK